FLEHLEELRWRIIKAAIAIVVFAIPAGIYWKQIFDFIMLYPLRLADPKPKLIYTNPSESFVISIKIAIAGGLIMAAPVVFFQLWKFVSPALYGNEKKVILPTVFASTFFFISGIVFSYLTFPYVMRFFTMFAGDRIDPMFKIGDYFGFLLKLSLAFGVVFELPVISFVLARLGLINASFLLKNIRYAVVVIFVIAAILTPPDVLSQVVMAVPLLVLYGLSILVVAFTSRRKA
ncbi:MAG: twin-arginine translocase subunit TatC, partial [Fibrobacter sp.]|nr:twin-arginine translocase subunit TatC [Fibrobacter sp.]